MVGRAYKKIRELILSNGKIMGNTSLQLVEINNLTLTQWHNKRSKKQELEVLQQGIDLPTPEITSQESFPEAKSTPTELPSGNKEDTFQFQLPPNTAGQGKTRKMPRPGAKTSTATASSAPPAIQPLALAQPVPAVQQLPRYMMVIQPGKNGMVPVFLPPTPQSQPPLPSMPQPFFPSTSNSSDLSIDDSLPRSTKSYQKRVIEKEASGEQVKRYHKREGPTKCAKCGQERGQDHRQYYGNWFCPKTETQSEEEWSTEMAEKRKKRENLKKIII